MKQCRHFSQGRCKFGARCRFAHSVDSMSTGKHEATSSASATPISADSKRIRPSREKKPVAFTRTQRTCMFARPHRTPTQTHTHTHHPCVLSFSQPVTFWLPKAFAAAGLDPAFKSLDRRVCLSLIFVFLCAPTCLCQSYHYHSIHI